MFSNILLNVSSLVKTRLLVFNLINLIKRYYSIFLVFCQVLFVKYAK
jgi:hypothetical protein